MTASRTIRVYLADDHEIVRRGVASLLESDPSIEVVGEAGDAGTALREILALRPDVVVLENHLPGGSGVELCREMRAAAPGTRALILTTHEDPEAISAAVLAGAAGYVLKRIEGQALVGGIRLVAAGHSLIDPAVAACVMQRVAAQRRSVDLVRALTPQQRKVLRLIGEGMTNKQIAAHLFLAEKTVKNHVTGLLAGLGVEHRTQAALLAAKLLPGEGTARSARSRDLQAAGASRAA